MEPLPAGSLLLRCLVPPQPPPYPVAPTQPPTQFPPSRRPTRSPCLGGHMQKAIRRGAFGARMSSPRSPHSHSPTTPPGFSSVSNESLLSPMSPIGQSSIGMKSVWRSVKLVSHRWPLWPCLAALSSAGVIVMLQGAPHRKGGVSPGVLQSRRKSFFVHLAPSAPGAASFMGRGACQAGSLLMVAR